jgi:hypothetical protein
MKATMVLLVILYLVVLFVLLGLPSTTDAHCGLPRHRTLDAATLEPHRGCAEHPSEIRHDPARVGQRAACAEGLTAGPCPERPSLPDRRHLSVEQGAR